MLCARWLPGTRAPAWFGVRCPLAGELPPAGADQPRNLVLSTAPGDAPEQYDPLRGATFYRRGLCFFGALAWDAGRFGRLSER